MYTVYHCKQKSVHNEYPQERAFMYIIMYYYPSVLLGVYLNSMQDYKRSGKDFFCQQNLTSTDMSNTRKFFEYT